MRGESEVPFSDNPFTIPVAERVKRLPPYLFGKINKLKYEKRVAGIDVIDASCGGIGGCPFAPSATGNVATEDVVYMLERAGFETGLDLSRLIETANWLEGALGHPVSSSLSKAGAFPG